MTFFVFGLQKEETSLGFLVYDWDRVGHDDLCGLVELPMPLSKVYVRACLYNIVVYVKRIYMRCCTHFAYVLLSVSRCQGCPSHITALPGFYAQPLAYFTLPFALLDFGAAFVSV